MDWSPIVGVIVTLGGCSRHSPLLWWKNRQLAHSDIILPPLPNLELPHPKGDGESLAAPILASPVAYFTQT